MEKDVDDVVAQRVQAPKVVFDPESGVDDGVVLGIDVGWIEIASRPGTGAQDWILGDVLRVVPDEISNEKDGQIREEDQSQKK